MRADPRLLARGLCDRGAVSCRIHGCAAESANGRGKAVVSIRCAECGDIIGRFNRHMRFASQRRSGEAPSSDAKTLPGGVHSVCQCPNREGDDRDQYRHLPG
jgi:hypothetical protein